MGGVKLTTLGSKFYSALFYSTFSLQHWSEINSLKITVKETEQRRSRARRKKVSEIQRRWRIAEGKADEGEEQERAEIKESEEKFAVVALHIMSNKEQIMQPLIR